MLEKNLQVLKHFFSSEILCSFCQHCKKIVKHLWSLRYKKIAVAKALQKKNNKQKSTNILVFYTVETIKLFFNIIIFSLSVAPKISSSCSRNRVIACVCEARGNPCPTLAWRLSGHVLTNSTETSISEEKLGSTGVKSILTTRQSLTDMDVLQCFSKNTHGSASQQFQTFPPPQETSEKHKTTALPDRQDHKWCLYLCENEVRLIELNLHS